ncbi:MAG: MAPEG family protein [Beijerinckiaceae bacterium]
MALLLRLHKWILTFLSTYAYPLAEKAPSTPDPPCVKRVRMNALETEGRAMTIVPSCAALLAFGYIFLSWRVIALRRARRVAIGAQGDPVIERAMRVHANFVEYAPFALLLLFMLEMNGGDTMLLNMLCATLVAGRALHAYGVALYPEDFRGRGAGLAMTLGVIATTSISLIWLAALARV